MAMIVRTTGGLMLAYSALYSAHFILWGRGFLLGMIALHLGQQRAP